MGGMFPKMILMSCWARMAPLYWSGFSIWALKVWEDEKWRSFKETSAKENTQAEHLIKTIKLLSVPSFVLFSFFLSYNSSLHSMLEWHLYSHKLVI